MEVKEKFHSVSRASMGESLKLASPPSMVCNSNQIVAITSHGETLNILKPVDLKGAMNSNNAKKEIGRSLAEGLFYLHSHNIYIGSDIHQDNILAIQSQTGLAGVFRTNMVIPLQDTSMVMMKEDHDRLAELLSYLWKFDTNPSNNKTLNCVQTAFLVKLTDSGMKQRSTWKLWKDIVFWSDTEVLDFFISVSEVLELKQKIHKVAIEDNSQDVVGSSWLTKLDSNLQATISTLIPPYAMYLDPLVTWEASGPLSTHIYSFMFTRLWTSLGTTQNVKEFRNSITN